MTSSSELGALGTLAPELLSAHQRVATIESLGSSSRIEGSKLSDLDVQLLLSNFENHEVQEVAGDAEVMEAVFALWENITVTENQIRQLHRVLLKYCHKDKR